MTKFDAALSAYLRTQHEVDVSVRVDNLLDAAEVATLKALGINADDVRRVFFGTIYPSQLSEVTALDKVVMVSLVKPMKPIDGGA